MSRPFFSTHCLSAGCQMHFHRANIKIHAAKGNRWVACRGCGALYYVACPAHGTLVLAEKAVGVIPPAEVSATARQVQEHGAFGMCMSN